jgi:hypothetical protein
MERVFNKLASKIPGSVNPETLLQPMLQPFVKASCSWVAKPMPCCGRPVQVPTLVSSRWAAASRLRAPK